MSATIRAIIECPDCGHRWEVACDHDDTWQHFDCPNCDGWQGWAVKFPLSEWDEPVSGEHSGHQETFDGADMVAERDARAGRSGR